MASPLNASFRLGWNNFCSFVWVGASETIETIPEYVINRISFKLDRTQLSVAIWVLLEELSAGKRLWFEFNIPGRSSSTKSYLNALNIHISLFAFSKFHRYLCEKWPSVFFNGLHYSAQRIYSAPPRIMLHSKMCAKLWATEGK